MALLGKKSTCIIRLREHESSPKYRIIRQIFIWSFVTPAARGKRN